METFEKGSHLTIKGIDYEIRGGRENPHRWYIGTTPMGGDNAQIIKKLGIKDREEFATSLGISKDDMIPCGWGIDSDAFPEFRRKEAFVTFVKALMDMAEGKTPIRSRESKDRIRISLV